VSADGTVVVGRSFSVNGEEAFRWKQGVGMVGLGDLPGGTFQSVAWGVANDGSVVVGTAVSGLGQSAFQWTQQGGMASIGHLPGGQTSLAHGVSYDGSVIVGSSVSQAFRWTAGTGMVGLGDLPGGEYQSVATAVSGDGQTVVGRSRSIFNGHDEPFRWRASTGMVGLGWGPDGPISGSAWATTQKGDIVVGHSSDNLGDVAFIWHKSLGLRNIQQLLEEIGVAPPGWKFQEASGISADGRTIVGVVRRYSPPKESRVWVLRQNLEACCFADEGCANLDPAFCEVLSGVSLGQGSSCAAPDITCPENLTVECDQPIDPSKTGIPTVTDECNGTLTLEFSDSGGVGPCGIKGAIARTWIVNDADDNLVSCLQIIERTDSTPPSVECPDDVVVQCSGPFGTSVETVPFDASATDACDTSVSIIDDRPETMYPPSCGSPGTIVTFTATDDCEQTASCSARVEVVGVQCCEPQACCVQGEGCVDILPSSCYSQGGSPLGVGTVCAIPRACCRSGGTCNNNDIICCLSQDGSPSDAGQLCEGDADGDGVDGLCGDACPDDRHQIASGPCPCGVPPVDSDGDGVLDCSEIPTVSTWGLLIMTLLLVIAWKLHFEQRWCRVAER